MPWNEPGDRDDKSKKKDPWNQQDNDGPPNIDEALKQLQRKLRSVFGYKDGAGSGMRSSQSIQGRKYNIGLFVFIALAIYMLCGIYVVEPAEEAVILRFGQYIRTEGAGPHWIAPFIETKDIVNVQEVKTTKHGGQMLTKDENIVSAEIAVQYRINNAKDYLFNLAQPERSLQQVSESALRSVVGQSTLNEVLTSGRSEIGSEIRKQVQQILNHYQAGLEISDLAMQQTKAPEEVKAAFDDAIKAQQDEERLVNEAEAYSRKIIPIAEGQAKRTVQEAGAYKEQVVLNAEGKTAKFAKVLPEYQKAREVTRERLFLDTMQEVYTNTPKVLVDTNGGNNLVYLPLDRLIRNAGLKSQALLVKEEDGSPLVTGGKVEQSVYPHRVQRPSYEDTSSQTSSGAS